MPKISVIIPTYNCVKYLHESIESALNQTYKDFEIIVVDDGSTDKTREELSQYNGKIRYFYQENQGLPSARNAGIKESKGEYIAILDADDELPEDALLKCIIAITKTKADWCIVDILRIENGINERRTSNVPSENYFLSILKSDFIRVATFFRKETLLEIGLYDESQIIREDWDLKIRLIGANKKFVYINEPLYIYKVRKSSLVKNNTKKVLFFTNKLLQKHHKYMADRGNKQIAKIYSEHMWNIAKEYMYKLKDFKNFIYCTNESLKYDFNISRLTHPFYIRLKKLIKK